MNKICIIGDEINSLTLLELKVERNKSGKWLSKFSCICGNIILRQTSVVYNNSIKSCGCSKKDHTRLLTALKSKLWMYKYGTRSAVKKFRISNAFAFQLFQSPCFYCGEFSDNEFGLNGIDRIENEDNYTITNVISCCTMCNVAKHYHSTKFFLDKVRKINLHLNLVEQSYNIIDMAKNIVMGEVHL